jgi:hypothetical protein
MSGGRGRWRTRNPANEVTVDTVLSIALPEMHHTKRNHLINLAWFDLSNALASHLGQENANFCTFAQ